MKFSELFELYYSRHVLAKNKNHANARYFYQRHGSTWADHPVSEFDAMALQRWVDQLGVDRGTQGANRAINQLAACLNWGVRRGYLPTAYVNPCKFVERFRAKPRERFLLPEELQKFRASVDKEQPAMKDFLWMLLLTGARRSNVAAMRWDHIDTQLAIWCIPDDEHKNGASHTVALSIAALAVLARRKAAHSSPWVFPSPRSKSGHLEDPKRAWHRVMKNAGLANLTIHDLRRTVGSYMAIQGESLLIIGKALGHKDPRSTAVYARLNLQPVREAVDRVQSVLLS